MLEEVSLKQATFRGWIIGTLPVPIGPKVRPYAPEFRSFGLARRLLESGHHDEKRAITDISF